MEARDSDSGLKAWSTEGTNYLKTGKAQIQANQILLVTDEKLAEFDEDTEDTRHILVGARGTGKSLSLARKSVLFHSDDGYTVIPSSHPYYIQLQTKIDVSSVEGAFQFCNHHWWQQAWKLATGLIFFYSIHRRSFDDGFIGKKLVSKKSDSAHEFFNTAGERIHKALPHREPLTAVLQEIVRRKYTLETCMEWFDRYLRDELLATSDHCFVMVIDQIDEALTEHRKPRQSDSRFQQSPWEAAQTGIIDASLDVRDATAGRCKIIASVRAEAYRSYEIVGSKQSQQASAFCIELRYERAMLTEIFQQNVARTKSKRLFDSKRDDPAEQFFGRTKYRHQYVPIAVEHPVDWIIRHTFASPRELVYIGQEIHQNIEPKNRVIRAELSTVLNSAAKTVFGDFKRELVPSWDTEMDAFIKKLPRNVLCRDTVAMLGKDGLEETSASLAYLYDNGLLGVPAPKPGDPSRCTLEFLGIKRRGRNNALPDSNYFVLHPAMYGSILEGRSDHNLFHYSGFVVGDGLECPQTLVSPRVVADFDYRNLKMHVSLFGDNNSISPSESERAENRLAALSSGPGDNVAGPLFYGILVATAICKRESVSVDETVDALGTLVRWKYVKDTYGNAKNRKPTQDYFRSELSQPTSDKRHCIQSLRTRLKASQSGLKLDISNGQFALEGVSWNEILINVV
ncbi:MAG: hypothetical protein AAF004_04435 [Pseudomonadota bacterium]